MITIEYLCGLEENLPAATKAAIRAAVDLIEVTTPADASPLSLARQIEDAYFAFEKPWFQVLVYQVHDRRLVRIIPRTEAHGNVR
jgi:hypothetical protein